MNRLSLVLTYISGQVLIFWQEGQKVYKLILQFWLQIISNYLINIVGNIVGKVDVVERENKNGEAFKMANFSVVSKDDEGNKIYHNCSAYGETSDIPKDFKQGDFVKLFG